MHEVIPRSVRAKEWQEFSDKVTTHIDNYAVPQYGDAGFDRVDEYTQKDCIKAIQRYCARFGRNARPGQAKLDMLKITHYACFTYDKIKENTNEQMG